MSAADKYYSDEILGSYDKSFAELEKIEQELENPEISVDKLSELADRSLPLIRSCKSKLLEAQEEKEAALPSELTGEIDDILGIRPEEAEEPAEEAESEE